MMMEQDAKRVGRQARNPSHNPEMMMEQNLFLGRIGNPIQLQSCLGNKANRAFGLRLPAFAEKRDVVYQEARASASLPAILCDQLVATFRCFCFFKL